MHIGIYKYTDYIVQRSLTVPSCHEHNEISNLQIFNMYNQAKYGQNSTKQIPAKGNYLTK